MDDRYYILEGKKAVPVSDLLEWARWFQENDRRVGLDKFGYVEVSTVFLGLNHAFFDGPPMLFETMIFGGPHDQECERCTTWEQAEVMHRRACMRARHVA